MKKVLKEIKEIKIQGASNVAKASLELINDLIKSKYKNKSELIKRIKGLKRNILNLRPTEPLISNFYNLIIQSLEASKAAEKKKLTTFARKKIKEILYFYDNQEKKIVTHGVRLIKQNDNVFTHCHSSVVEKILIEAKKTGKKFKIYNSETRPLFQGRLMAKNLAKHNIKTTMVVDSAAPFLVSDHSGDDIKIDKVILGADVLGLNGEAVNKIGSFGIALTAWESKIPVYIAASLFKTDTRSGSKISVPLEKRKASEIWANISSEIRVENYAFDYIPAKFISGYITEFGIIKPTQIRQKVKKEYPCLF